MDVITLSLAKKYANKVAAGFSSVQVDGSNLIFTLNDGTKATMTIPAPENGSDGVSVIDLSIDTDGSLLCHMSDGSTIDAGKVPTIEPEHVQADWNQNDSTQPDYVKNRICYVNYLTNTLIDNKTFTFTKNPYKQYEHEFTEEEKLDAFTYETDGEIIFNGVRYPAFRNFLIESDMFSGYCANIDRTYVYIYSDQILISGYPSDSDNVDITITFSLLDENVVKLPEKYLPNTVATKEYVNNNTPEQIQSDWNQNDETQPDYIKNRICYSEGSDTKEIVILERASRQFTSVDYGGDVGEFGEYYFSNEEESIMSDLKGKSGILRFTLGETVSEETVENLDEHTSVSFYLDGIPFIVTSDMIGLPQYPSKYYDISLTFITTEENIIKLPEKYLPDTVATKEYVDDIFNSIVNGDEVSY